MEKGLENQAVQDAGVSGAGPIRMSDIARAAGVSVVTVSRSLNHPDKVSADTRKRVIEAMERAGYVPDQVAGSLVTRKSHAIGLVIPTVTNSLFADTIQGISEVLEPRGYQLMIGSSRYDPDVEQALVRTLLSRRCDAVILTGVTHTEGTRRLLEKSGVPVVEMWNLCDDPIDTLVGFSNFEAARQMTLHLGRRGYRNIAFMGGDTAQNDRTTHREEGYLAALDELGLARVPDRIERGSFDFRNGARGLRALLERCPEIDAIFTASDVLAVGAIFECMRAGWPVPGRVAIAGLDDSVIAGEVVPALTTVRIPRHQIGLRIGEVLLDRLEGRRSAAARIDLGFEIISRESA